MDGFCVRWCHMSVRVMDEILSGWSGYLHTPGDWRHGSANTHTLTVDVSLSRAFIWRISLQISRFLSGSSSGLQENTHTW